jgi:hypothetical protein
MKDVEGIDYDISMYSLDVCLPEQGRRGGGESRGFRPGFDLDIYLVDVQALPTQHGRVVYWGGVGVL